MFRLQNDVRSATTPTSASSRLVSHIMPVMPRMPPMAMFTVTSPRTLSPCAALIFFKRSCCEKKKKKGGGRCGTRGV
jgi:hypothetical protein